MEPVTEKEVTYYHYYVNKGVIALPAICSYAHYNVYVVI